MRPAGSSPVKYASLSRRKFHWAGKAESGDWILDAGAYNAQPIAQGSKLKGKNRETRKLGGQEGPP